MKPQDHSDTTLLIWSDWLEENEQEQKAHELREEIAHPIITLWCWEYLGYSGSRVGGGYDAVGGCLSGEDVGGGLRGGVGDAMSGFGSVVGGLAASGRVGGGGINVE